jgi:transcriptional regulator
MYTPSYFAQRDGAALQRLIREHPLATLVSVEADGVVHASHVPMLPDADCRVLRCHLARANPHASVLAKGGRALAMFNGPQHYISPGWYPSKATDGGRVVPTWNYAVVHVRGSVAPFTEPETLLQHLREITEAQEQLVGGDWSIDDAPREYLENLVRGIVGIELRVESIEGKWKLSQNRSRADREAVVGALEALGSGSSRATAEAMKAASSGESR